VSLGISFYKTVFKIDNNNDFFTLLGPTLYAQRLKKHPVTKNTIVALKYEIGVNYIENFQNKNKSITSLSLTSRLQVQMFYVRFQKQTTNGDTQGMLY